ncbi:MAG: hypothetical protein BWY70_00924 [Bacteroidetes bacterium ADurb.Bin408]|nr:MAG: hypothetical protein BWY70_00924 [Bacteroidetes bacterium ADurb.Bin408]
MTINSFEDLEIWQEAHCLAKYVFELTKKENFSKDFRFRDQIRASSGSIMDNIAEGFERGGNKEFSQFLSIAKGSNGETRSQSYRAHDYSYIDDAEFKKLLNNTASLATKIGNLIDYLKKSEFKGKKYKYQNPPSQKKPKEPKEP